MQIEWWIWLLLGIALMLLEMTLPTFIILWFGVCAVLVGVIGSFTHFQTSTEVMLWTGLSLVTTTIGLIISRNKPSDNAPR